jgi:hypothetical protein
MTASTKAKFLEVAIDQDMMRVTATFGNGEVARVQLSDLPVEIIHAAALLGLSNKVRDTAANYSKDVDYDGAFEAMQETIEALKAGTWNRNGGGVAGVKMKDLATAIAELKSTTFDKAFAVVKAAEKEQRAAWAKNAAIAAIMARLEMDRMNAKAATATDADGLPTFDL